MRGAELGLSAFLLIQVHGAEGQMTALINPVITIDVFMWIFSARVVTMLYFSL